jgi:transporter family protein
MATWFVLTLGALGLWGIWGFLAKLGSDNLTAKSAATMQGMGVAAVAFAVLGFMRFKPDWDTGGTPAAFLAGVALMAGVIAFVFALSHGGKASIVVPMTAMYPVVTIGLSVAILKEQITPTTGLGIVFALIAVFLLSR